MMDMLITSDLQDDDVELQWSVIGVSRKGYTYEHAS